MIGILFEVLIFVDNIVKFLFCILFLRDLYCHHYRADFTSEMELSPRKNTFQTLNKKWHKTTHFEQITSTVFRSLHFWRRCILICCVSSFFRDLLDRRLYLCHCTRDVSCRTGNRYVVTWSAGSPSCTLFNWKMKEISRNKWKIKDKEYSSQSCPKESNHSWTKLAAMKII